MDDSLADAAAVHPAERHRAREAALRMLYQLEIGRGDVAEVLESYWTIEFDESEPAVPEVVAFARGLVEGTAAALDTIDPLIAASAEHWKIGRMAAVDRQVLRMAVYELRRGTTPAAVVINEALELARAYSGEDAVGFVNGVLDAVRRRLAQDD